jgi:hypothetical protein
MRGRDGKTYYDSASNWDTPTWVEIVKVIDETVTPSADAVAGGSRESEHEDNEIVNQKFAINLTYRYKKASVGTDTVYAAMLAHFEAGTPVFMAFMDGGIAVNGSKGWRAPVKLTEMPQQRNLGGMVEVTISGVGCIYDDSGTLRTRTSYTYTAPTTTTTAP